MKVALAARARGAENLDVTTFLPWVARLGYTGVEVGKGVFENGPGPAQFRSLAEEAGLEITTFMGSREMLRDEFEMVVDACRTLDCAHVVQAWGPVESAGQLREAAAEYDETGARYREQGLQYCYHNHDHEVGSVFGDRCALDILLENTSAENFKLQVDLGWVSYGGQDPARFLDEHQGLCPVVHLRDVGDPEERGRWAPIGQGVLDIPEIVKAALNGGTRWVILEQKALGDLSRDQGIEACAEYMRQQGLL
ncbi:MAG: sugar phosphate isomerase/epimerase family protein [Planctomycetota bacterium]